MYKLIIQSLFFSSALISSSYSQKIINVHPWQNGQKIEILYDLVGVKYYQTIHVDLYISLDGGNTYQGPLQLVSGEIGDSILQGRSKQISWDVFKEMPTFTGTNVIFDVRAEIVEEKLRHKFYLGYTTTYTAPVGFILGLTGKTGFYISTRLNPMHSNEIPYVTKAGYIDGYPEDGYYKYTEETDFQRLSVLMGLTFRLGWKTHLYMGGGFSQYNYLWNIDQFEYPDIKTGNTWVKETDMSFDYFEIEGGLQFNYKYVFFTLGVTSPGLQWAEPTISLGVTF